MSPLPETVASADQIALLPQWRRDLIHAYQEGASYQRLAGMLSVSQFDKDLVKKDKDKESTVSLLRGICKPHGKEALEILHVIPRSSLGALLSGMVGSDVLNRLAEGYSDDGAGVYVIGLTIDGRSGAFISSTEMQTLIDDLEQYVLEVEAALDQDTAGGQPGSTVWEVDHQYGIYTPGANAPSRFIESRSSLDSMRELLAATKTRQSSLSALDGTGTLCSVQAPMYVGCGQNVRDRIRVYAPVQQVVAFKNASKPYGLFMSLLHKQGLIPRPMIIAVVRTWGRHQMATAERLVTALAGSYVHQGGFNIQEGGGNSPPFYGNVLDVQTYVMVTKGFWKANFDLSRTELATAAELDLEVTAAANTKEVASLVGRNKELVEVHGETTDQISALAADVGELGQARQKKADEGRRLARGLAKTSDMMELLVSLLEAGDDEDVKMDL
ncbi:hypothetical protein QBC39DRAFT_29890 [Podospora conica]|nr:hypothetical protein QBC39DRAFT_29890 [Schizothecium conicum]